MPRTPEFSSTVILSDVGEQLAQDMDLLGDRVGVAVSRALKKLARWLRTHSMREIGRELGITQKVLKRRFRVDFNNKSSGPQVQIWFGLLNVAAHELGNARQNAAGARVRRHQFDGAFVQTIYGEQEKVYIRTSRNQTAGHATYSESPPRFNRGDRRFLDYGGPDDRSNRGRFPVQVVGLEIESVATEVLERYESRINARYAEILEQEVNFALNVEFSR